jgi:hypothetical protein
MSWLLVFACLLVLLLVYVFLVRPAIREMPAFDPFFDWIEPYERVLWAKSRTILVGRLYWLGGLLLTLHDTLGSLALDWTPLVARALAGVPDDIRPLVMSLAVAGFVSVTGFLFNHLRKVTSEPLADKE